VIALALVLACLDDGPREEPRGLDSLAPYLKALQQEPPPANPQELEPAASGFPILDLDRLEANPRVGFLAFSEDFEAKPSVAFSLLLRAPMPGLTPGWDPEYDHLGVFFEFLVSSLERDVDPPVPHDSGLLLFYTLGIDWTVYQAPSWRVLVLGGLQYGTYSDITDSEDGFAGLAGASLHVRAGDSLWLSVAPEVIFAHAGDRMMGAHLGLVITF
jgi:hypothetical protein